MNKISKDIFYNPTCGDLSKEETIKKLVGLFVEMSLNRKLSRNRTSLQR